MKPFFIIAYAVAVHAALVFVIVKSDFTLRVKNFFASPAKELGHSRHYQVMRKVHQSIDGNVPPNTVLFVGDSLIQGLLCSRVADNAVNLGIGTDTTVGVMERLEVYDSVKEAELIVFGVGLNDLFLADRSPDQILENYRRMRSLVPEDTAVVFSAILPVADPIEGRWLNSEIKQVNQLLEQYCAETDEVWFCAPGDLMVDETGNLDDGLHLGDGVHLNARGNEIWITALKTTIEKIRRRSTETSDGHREG